MTFLIKKEWLENFVKEMKKGFGSRIEFIGLQGSHGRGEASEESDIDIVVILDKVDIEDLKKYDEIISKRVVSIWWLNWNLGGVTWAT